MTIIERTDAYTVYIYKDIQKGIINSALIMQFLIRLAVLPSSSV